MKDARLNRRSCSRDAGLRHVAPQPCAADPSYESQGIAKKGMFSPPMQPPEDSHVSPPYLDTQTTVDQHFRILLLPRHLLADVARFPGSCFISCRHCPNWFPHASGFSSGASLNGSMRVRLMTHDAFTFSGRPKIPDLGGSQETPLNSLLGAC